VDPVFIESWPYDEDFPYHPIGSQPKQTLICPLEETDKRVIPGQAYIFKTAKREWQIYQLWSELIAARFGQALGLDVPTSHVALNRNTGALGVLMESFLRGPGISDSRRLVHGKDILARVLRDKKTGRPHSLNLNLWICRLMGAAKLTGTSAWSAVDWWAKTIAFDALIGNSDRHPENWGFLIDPTTGFTMAPVFDNGTSLGYEHSESKIGRWGPIDIERYVSKGTHHCSWALDTERGAPHIDLCWNLVQAHVEASASMKSVIRYEQQLVDDILQECCTYVAATPFTSARAEFVRALLVLRRKRLYAVLGA